jgi:phosphopantothenoylcysteine decarboxylase/phosphopantothenate--cysteine ligase
VLSRLSARRRPGQLLCGFAAEHGPEAVKLAREKLTRKGLDAIVVNDISRSDIGFDAPANEVTVLTAAGGERAIPRMSKDGVADAILDELSALWADPRTAEDGAGTVTAR